eukprot:Phypoly_transcript_08173.p1 GENE.Phypoly_transcript_08173~~Phypoly_transcript_08173.p1  ORF type:complete len:510 (+),score=94.21 Phypoly_transcript_08173:44-1531(+)
MAGVLAIPLVRGPYASALCRAAGKRCSVVSPIPNPSVFPKRAYSRSHEDLDNLGGYDMKKDTNPKVEELIKSLDEEVKHLIPREIVAELDRFIIGQNDAKRAVAVALRNRWRRRKLSPKMREEVIPKNILMVGPTGVGKTEIARRLAKLISAPFIKVEATKFTEVGFHGRDVDQIIRDLVDIAIFNTRQRLSKRGRSERDTKMQLRIIDSLISPNAPESERQKYLEFLKKGELDNLMIEIEVEPTQKNVDRYISAILESANRRRTKLLTIAEARKLLEKQQSDVDADTITQLAIHSVEQDGIVFIDEIDKICERKDAMHRSADASSEGVQRDLLPIIEGSVVHTKHGNVNTSHILFIASGAFHSNKPSDMISELQGRLPIRVELKPLETNDLYRIMTEPETNQIKQQMELLKTEGVNLTFSDKSIRAIAQIATDINSQVENIGARRLHTILEKVMEDISFNSDLYKDKDVVVEEEDVRKHLGEMLKKTDLSRFIL